MTAGQPFPCFPPDYDPFTPRVVATTAVPAKRLVVVLRSDEKSDRYALHRFPDGAVAWRADTFTAPLDRRDPEAWIGYGGELPVAEVIARVPDQRREVLEWTRDEIDSGLDVTDSDDPRVRERRARSLERLAGELESATR